jgi:hypothetical protein
MTLPNPFDPAPDRELGALLRAHLEAPGHQAFVAQILAAAGGRREEGSLQVLARWARIGIAAALLLATMGALATGLMARAGGGSADDALLPTPEVILASTVGAR